MNSIIKEYFHKKINEIVNDLKLEDDIKKNTVSFKGKDLTVFLKNIIKKKDVMETTLTIRFKRIQGNKDDFPEFDVEGDRFTDPEETKRTEIYIFSEREHIGYMKIEEMIKGHVSITEKVIGDEEMGSADFILDEFK